MGFFDEDDDDIILADEGEVCPHGVSRDRFCADCVMEGPDGDDDEDDEDLDDDAEKGGESGGGA